MSSIAPWRAIQRENFTDWNKLTAFLQMDEAISSRILKNPRFPLNLPKRLVEKIAKNTLDDPILRQFVPLKEENEIHPDFLLDPVCDSSFRKEKKLLHKYKGRALLVCTSACAMHCRYCFRQNFAYDTEDKLFDDELKIIEKDESISEILLSGGDPLSLSNELLENLISRLEGIPHIKRLRFHTRFPIGIPERIDEEFLKILSETKLTVYFVIHCNHAKELDSDVLRSLKAIQKLGINILNQGVLLKGINDDFETLKELFEKFIDNGILPYYFYQLDRVQGSMHFEVEEARGIELMKELQAHLPGYGMPRYVIEVAGESSKTAIAPTLAAASL